LLSNSSKYAKASLVQISFNVHDDNLVMILEDNGVGFDVSKKTKGIGIKNIEDRVEGINGDLIIESTFGAGSQVIVEVKLNNLND